MEPLVSVITPTYNSADFVSDAIRSVQNQTFQNWELVLIDDCSTDATVSIIQTFLSDPRIKLIRLEKNSGAGIARQTGVEAASGRYIAFLDSDDIWKPEKLNKQLAFMETNGLPFTFSFYELMDEAGNPMGIEQQAPSPLFWNQLKYCNFVGNLTGIYDCRQLGKIGISTLRRRQDWILWLQVIKKAGQGFPVEESLAYYRVRKTSISASKWKLVKSNYLVYREYHRENPLSACVSMLRFLLTQFLVKPRYKKTIPLPTK